MDAKCGLRRNRVRALAGFFETISSAKVTSLKGVETNSFCWQKQDVGLSRTAEKDDWEPVWGYLRKATLEAAPDELEWTMMLHPPHNQDQSES